MEDDVQSIDILQSKIALLSLESLQMRQKIWFQPFLWYFGTLLFWYFWYFEQNCLLFIGLSTNMLTFPLVLRQEWKLNKRPVWWNRTQKVCYVLQVVSI